jgi:molybdopterin/thiamine biosynthesis adenylyltransferase/rhodanese-related sulfurtransferase
MALSSTPLTDSSQRNAFEEARRRITRVTPSEALVLQADGALLLDVREPEELLAGAAPGALNVRKADLEAELDEHLPDRERTVLVMCQTGMRSIVAAAMLERHGYGDVRDVEGGFARWSGDGLPVELEGAGLEPTELRRYARHLIIPEVGAEGQRRLKAGRVLLVGAGGLGSPAAIYLACAGVGSLGIVDSDVVDESNLQRQILHTPGRLGMPKGESARIAIGELNPLVDVEVHQERLTSGNADRIVPGYDVVVDGADNFPTRYLINDACLKHDKPNVHGSVFRFEGQASVFLRGQGPCYRCLYPEPPPPHLTQSCAEAGVLGVLPGVIGLLQAIEVIKLLIGKGDPLFGRLLVYDALAASFRELKVRRRDDCAYCGEGRAFPGYIDYAGFCGA